MSTLIAVVFDDLTTAFEMRTALMKMQKEHLIELEDSVVVTQMRTGRTKLDQATESHLFRRDRRWLLGHVDRSHLLEPAARCGTGCDGRCRDCSGSPTSASTIR